MDFTPVMTPDAITIPVPAGWSPTLVLIIALLPIVSFGASFFASMLNESIRKKTAAGEKVAPVVTTFASILNFIAANFDKFRQHLSMAQGKVVISTVTTPPPAQTSPPVDPSSPPSPPKA